MIKLICIDAIYNQSEQSFSQQKRVSFVIDKSDVVQSLKKKANKKWNRHDAGIHKNVQYIMKNC